MFSLGYSGATSRLSATSLASTASIAVSLLRLIVTARLCIDIMNIPFLRSFQRIELENHIVLTPIHKGSPDIISVSHGNTIIIESGDVGTWESWIMDIDFLGSYYLPSLMWFIWNQVS